jgi:hypothetical protein
MQHRRPDHSRRAFGHSLAHSLAIHAKGGIFSAMRVPLLIGLTLIAAALAAPAHADGMRCGGRLIRDGDPRAQVRAFCGDPADVQTRSILRRPIYNVGGRQVFFGDALVEIPVETWTYNFGPNKLMRRVRFVDGIVEEVETLGYGYNDPQRGSYNAGN